MIYNTNNVDNIAAIPNTFKEYIDSLGKQTKKHAKYYLGRINRDFPQICFNVDNAINGTVSIEDYMNITNLSKQRMTSKNLKYNLSEAEDKKRYEELSRNGLILKATIDGNTVAGCIGYLINEDFYLCKIAHDNNFSRYNLGQVVLLKLIEYLTTKEIKRFHFLWNKGIDYKTRFGGIQFPLHTYYYYPHKNMSYYKQLIQLEVRTIKECTKDIIRKNKKILQLYHKITFATPIRDKIAISCMLRQIHEFSSHAIRHGLYIKNQKRFFCP